MVHVFLLGGAAIAAALLSTGCDSREEVASSPDGDVTQPDVEPSSDPTEDSSTALQNKPPSPPPQLQKTYMASFGRDLNAAKVYRKFLAKGVTPKDLDQGCVHYSNFVPTVWGAGDGRIEGCEVYRVALDSYKSYPKIARFASMYPIPWVLDDYDPKTDFDAKLRKRVKEEIDIIRNSEGLQGLNPKSNEYKKKLALALSYFSEFPKDPKLIKAENKIFASYNDRMAKEGLIEYGKRLFEMGGLGGGDTPKRELVKGRYISALEIYKQGKNAYLYKENLDYALFDMAGLDPVFLMDRISFQHSPIDPKDTIQRMYHNYSSVKNRIFVGILLSQDFEGKEPSYFIPQKAVGEELWDTLHLDALPIGLSIYLAENALTEAVQALGKAQGALEMIEESLNYYPTNSRAYNNLGVIYHELGMKANAERALLEAIRHDPNDGLVRFNKAYHCEKTHNKIHALKLYLMAFEVDPHGIGNYQKAASELAKNVLKESPENKNAKKILAEIKRFETGLEKKKRSPLITL